MEKHLINLKYSERVEPDPNAVVRAVQAAREMKTRLWLLGTKGSKRALQGEQVASWTSEQYMKYADAGLLYVERDELWAFAPALDANTFLPVLLDR
jgi:hypothetical protein